MFWLRMLFFSWTPRHKNKPWQECKILIFEGPFWSMKWREVKGGVVVVVVVVLVGLRGTNWKSDGFRRRMTAEREVGWFCFCF